LGTDGDADELVVTTMDGEANVAQQLWLELPTCILLTDCANHWLNVDDEERC
jgi:hypothetical protein